MQIWLVLPCRERTDLKQECVIHSCGGGAVAKHPRCTGHRTTLVMRRKPADSGCEAQFWPIGPNGGAADGGPASDPSIAAVPDRHLPVVDDDWHVPPAAARLEHPREVTGALLDVHVVDRVPLLRVRRPGVARVGSGVLAEDRDLLHRAPQGSGFVPTQSPRTPKSAA